MRDQQGRTRLQRWRENRFEKSFQDDLAADLKEVMEHPENVAVLKKFTSSRSLIKSILPQLILGSLIAYVEYRLVGPIYTIISLVVLFPLLYGYSLSLRTRNGSFIMYPSDDAMDWEKLFVSEQIWALVNKKTGLTLEEGRINGRITYWCTDVKFLPGTQIPFYVEIAWAHYNRAKYMMFASIIDDLTQLLKETLLEVAKLKKTSQVQAISEATRQTEEMVKSIEMAFRKDVHEIINSQAMDNAQAQLMEKNVNELLENPTFLKALIEKRKKEEQEVKV